MAKCVMKAITSLQHPLVQHWCKLKDDKRYRYEKKSVVIAGKTLVREICQSLPAIRLITEYPDDSVSIAAQEMICVSPSILRKITGLMQPEGIAAEVALPSFALVRHLPYVLALDGVCDPSNMGALLRSALALGWSGAILLTGCCDPYNDKAIRAAKGACFRLPLECSDWETIEKWLPTSHFKALAADMHGVAVEEVETIPPLILVMGNETHGLSTKALQLCKRVSIPLRGAMESLNVAVAGGILMHTLLSKPQGNN